MRADVLNRALKAFLAVFVWASCLATPAITLATDTSEILSQARAHREAGDLPEAAESFERLLATVGNRGAAAAELPAFHRELGEVYVALKRPRQAVEQYEASLAADPKQPVLRYRAGILYRQLSENSNAVEHLSEALDQGFRNTAVQFHLAAAQFGSGQLEAGLETARATLQQSTSGSDLALRVGRLLFEYHFYRDAIGAFELAFKRSSEALDVRVYLALTNHLLNRHERTVELLGPLAFPEGSGNSEALTLLAAALASLDRFDEAEALLERAIREEPSSPHAYLNLALVLLDQGKAEAAGDWFDQMFLSAGSASPKVFYAVQRNSCVDAYREIAAVSGGETAGADPERGLQLFEFARSLSDRHHHGTAVELLRIATRDTSDRELPRSRLHRQLGFSCLNLEPENETAAQLLQRAIELDPLDHQAYFLLGRAHQKKRRSEQAAKAFDRAIQLEPNVASYRTELARSLLSSRVGVDETARVIAILTNAIEIDSSDASARFELGKLWMGQGRLDTAEEHLRKAIESEPEFYEAYYVLGQVHARAKRTADARECFRIFKAKKAAIEARSAIWKDATAGLSAQ